MAMLCLWQICADKILTLIYIIAFPVFSNSVDIITHV